MTQKQPKRTYGRPKAVIIDDLMPTNPKPKFSIGQPVYFINGMTKKLEQGLVNQILDYHDGGFMYVICWADSSRKVFFHESELSERDDEAREVFISQLQLKDDEKTETYKMSDATSKEYFRGDDGEVKMSPDVYKPIMIRDQNTGELVVATSVMLEAGKPYMIDTETGEIYADRFRDFKTEELTAELKRRGLGVFPLGMPFIYKPKDV